MFVGVNLLQESNLVAGVLLNGMFLLGTFTFAVVLGVVSDDISSEVKVLHWLHACVAIACKQFVPLQPTGLPRNHSIDATRCCCCLAVTLIFVESLHLVSHTVYALQLCMSLQCLPCACADVVKQLWLLWTVLDSKAVPAFRRLHMMTFLSFDRGHDDALSKQRNKKLDAVQSSACQAAHSLNEHTMPLSFLSWQVLAD